MTLFPAIDELARDAARRRDAYVCGEYRRGAAGRLSDARTAARQGDCGAAVVALHEARRLVSGGMMRACPAARVDAMRRGIDGMARSVRRTCPLGRRAPEAGLFGR